MRQTAVSQIAISLIALHAFVLPRASPAQEPLELMELEELGATIRNVNIEIENVFDLSNPDEDKRLYRFANRVHVVSRRSTIEDILLIEPGQELSERLIEESERALRGRGFIADAMITASNYDATTNSADVDVSVKDAWSLTPELKLSRSGGENEYEIGMSEENLFGLGKDVTLSYSSDVDRDEAFFGYADSNVRGTRTTLNVELANTSDGDRQAFLAERPFYALDSRWTLGSGYLNDRRVNSMYGLGEVIDEFRHDTTDFSLFGGWSRGLVDRRSRRWLVGLNYEEDEFRPTPAFENTLLLPENRKLVFPWIGLQIVEDDFRAMTELNDMGRTEDIPLGLNMTLKLGYASTSYGADRDASILRASTSKGWEPGGSGRLLLFDLSASARHEDSGIENSIVASRFRYFHRNLQRHLFSASLTAVVGQRLDAENQILLGGDSGLRGFPLRYQSGERSLSLTLEQRFFTDWYPFRLLRVGYAVFFDAGRVWGTDARGTPNLGALYDIGVGLRLTSPRSTGSSVIHIDLAVPIDAPADVDSLQITVEKKSSF